MRSTFKILFYLNTSKRKKSGTCPVMGRITVDGKIAQFSLKEDFRPDYWDAQKGRASGKTREQIALNRKIDQTEQSIRDIYVKTVNNIGYVTAEQIKNELTGAVTKTEYLLELFKEHNQEFKKRVGIDRKDGTYRQYEGSYKHLSQFILSKYGMKDYPLKQLDMDFIDDFDYYLLVDAGLCANTTINHIISLKKIVSRAMSQKTILYDPFPEYELKKQKLKYLHLSKESLEKIMTTPIKSKSVSFVRDMFVFSCFTGLAYADVCQLSEKHLSVKPDGSTWIEIPRYKTDVESLIRLLDIPVAIIEKYRHLREGDRLFKLPNSSGVGKHLRKIAKLCGIEHLHFHMARHTFATLICLSNGVSMKTLSKLMGHSSMRTTKKYGEITNQKVGAEMKKLAGRSKMVKRSKIKKRDKIKTA